MESIITDIKKNLEYARNQKEQNRVFEETPSLLGDKYSQSLTAIQQTYLKRYQVPIQYWHIFGIVISKYNNFHHRKTGLLKKVDKNNKRLLDIFLQSPGEFIDFVTYTQNYLTYKDIDTTFEQERSKKWEERLVTIGNSIKQNNIPQTIKQNQLSSGQLVLNF